MSEDQEISSSVIDSHVGESNSNALNSDKGLTIIAQNVNILGESNSCLPNSNEDLTIIAQNPIIHHGSNSNSLNSNQGLTIIVKNPIILDGSNSNSNSLNSSQTSTIEAQNVTIITPESRSIIPQLSLDFGVDPRYATIFAKQTHIGTNQNFSYDILSSNDPEVQEEIGKLVNEAKIDAIKRLMNKPDRTDGIPNDVLDYLVSKMSKNGTTTGSDKTTNDDAQRNNVQLISVDTKDIPLDKVDVVYGNNYTTIKAKKGFGISKLTKANKLIWESILSSKYVIKFLLYNEGEKSYAFLLLNDMSLVSLERKDWNVSWKIVANKFDFNHLNILRKNGYLLSQDKFALDFHEHYLDIFIPFISNEITYYDSLVFKYDDGNYPLFLSVDLLTCQITVHLCQNKINHNLAQFKLGHELSDVEKRGEEDVPFLENIREFISSIHGPNEMDGITSSEKLTSKLRDRYTNSTITKHSNSDGSSSQKNQQKFDSESANKCDTEGIKIHIVELNINVSRSEYYNRKFNRNSRYYRANENVLFDKVIDGKKVIWKKKKNRLLAKEVYFYFDDNVKWVIILLKNNTLKFYHKPSDTREWTDVSTKMISTDILKVINSNLRKQSRMDLNFDFFSSFCLIDLGNAVSVGYKDYVQYFKGYGTGHSDWLLFDVLTKNVYIIEFILKTQNQLTNQH
ncbi:Theileria-specific hypothetical protein family member, putative [Theileria annulata]|uniref:Uncharacterized protein n=1 Tax=Theileria annulata TaxID=5874 RepID=Q4UDA6_THEAN|nr:Theileria-specific hypothetical protein family member, putative [Theileria annulata]CAI74933.1 Theileria-specific hypothetical protein family member, putative [Theileria annulata]|eukprot:XP_952665.1 Theileria-specific hypothetical protein family member, putative [Theileria annulata]